MAGNISDYVRWRGDLPFNTVPFNNVDAIIFAQLTYNKLEGLMSERFDESITLEELVERFAKAPDFSERKNLGFMINPETVELLFLCAKSERFGHVKVSAFRSIYNEENCEQFAAATFTFENNSVVAFRGTDDYLIGWKEDCNISYMDPIPAQFHALEYLQEAAFKFKKNNLYVTGQSKGGNLAVYAGVKADFMVKHRIRGIYNLDGPGFPKEFLQKHDFKSVKSKIISLYPEYDIVGMFFAHDDNYTIFKSNAKGMRQHDTMTWLVLGNNVVPADSFTRESKLFSKSFNEWADGMTSEEKKVFIDAVFEILMAGGYKTNLELSENLILASPKMVEAFARMDRKTKSNVHKIVTELKNAIKEELPIFNVLAFAK